MFENGRVAKHDQRANHVQKQYIFEVVEGLARYVLVKHDRFRVKAQQKQLVRPVGHYEEEAGDGVQNWQAGRVEECHREYSEHVWVAELEHEFVASVHIFVVSLRVRPRVLIIVTPAKSAATIQAPLRCVQTLETHVCPVRRHDHQQESRRDCRPHFAVPLLTKGVKFAFQAQRFPTGVIFGQYAEIDELDDQTRVYEGQHEHVDGTRGHLFRLRLASFEASHDAQKGLWKPIHEHGNQRNGQGQRVRANVVVQVI